jgi:internalin A
LLNGLEAAGKGIQNLKGIENLTSLSYLDLGRKWEDGGWNYNIIKDLSPISNLININYLDLSGNKIKTIEPLLKNNGITAGDYVNLRYNNLNLNEENQTINNIKELKEKEIEIKYE